MLEHVLKVLLTSVLVVAAVEAAKRSAVMGALVASVPLTSLLAIVWLYAETRDVEKVAALASGVFWLVLPSLTLLAALPLLLRNGVPFAPSLLISMALTVACYLAMLALLRWFGVHI